MADDDTAPAPGPPRTFGRYRLDATLGHGGTGEVFRAYDEATDRDVALKLLAEHLGELPGYTARFHHECELAARLTEPHVVPIHSYGELDGRLYVDMRLVEGVDLRSLLAEHRPIAPDVAVAVVGQVARALDAAHAIGLVHHDVKPSNILLTTPDAGVLDATDVFAYLLDFGIAGARRELTRSGERVVPGTPAYVAPERLRGAEGDHRVDVYALACVLHEALTGRPPYTGDAVALVAAHLYALPPRASKLAPAVPPELDDVIATGLAKDPEDRYATAGALAGAARAALRSVSRHVPLPESEATGSTSRTEPVHPGATGSTSRTEPVHPGAGGSTSRGEPARPAAARDGAGAAAPAGRSEPVGHAGHLTVPPVPTRRRRRSRLARAAALVAVAVALAVAATAGVAYFRSTAAEPPDPADSTLLAALPAGFSAANCRAVPEQRAATGAVAFVRCADGPADGPQVAEFARFPDADALTREFARQVGAGGVPLTAIGTVEGCPQGRTVRARLAAGAGPVTGGGWIACAVAARAGGPPAAYLLWIDDGTLTLGYLRRDDADADALYAWWRRASLRTG
ncbi:MAG: serine/threonine-protein kinase [Pseudonocardia sp.]